MSLASGTRLGAYEIVGTLGAGGMGEVYRARDSRLQRDVAIKVLPPVFAADAERLARFAREAQVLASLNHPHIAHVYGFEGGSSAAGPQMLVMELVDGPTLADRIARGPIPADEVLPLARQIGDALEAAHQRGVIHRDLKPANIKITADGTVKVLDFGLAKALAGADDAASGSVANSPTITTPAMTHAGVILGTAAYMSPEQARGRAVDKRADIWAFGVVLYEMLTARRPFEGETVSDTLASVLKTEPDWTLVPSHLRRLIQACLEKDPSRRLRDVGDAWRLLDDASSDTRASRSPTRLLWLIAAIAAVCAIAATALAVVHFREQPPAVMPIRFQIPPPDKTIYDIYLSLAPNGRSFAFTARDVNGVSRIWIRDLDQLEPRPVPGTENAWGPFWSPDSRFLGFALNGQLKKIDLTGGPPQTLCEVPFNVGTGAWNRDGVILFGSRGGGSGALHRVSAAGGQATPITMLDQSRQEPLHALPVFLPDGRHFIYLRLSSQPERQGLYLGSLDRSPAEQPTARLVPSQYAGAFAPDDRGGGQLLFLRDDTLMAQPFDLATLALTGESIPIVEQIGRSGSFGFFSVSAGNVLIYRTGNAMAPSNGTLTWFDRTGKRLGVVGDAAATAGFALSPDGSRVAIVRGTSALGEADIWLFDFARGVSTRFTFTANLREDSPVWSPDGSRIAYRSNRSVNYDLFEKVSNGAGDERVIREAPQNERPTDWSMDGRLLFYEVGSQPRADTAVLPLEGDRTPVVLHQTEFNEIQPRLSPDGRWLAYGSNESGRNEVYVRPFSPPGSTTAPGGKWQLSRDGGLDARWRRDGKELFFRSADGAIMAVDVRPGAAFDASEAKPLFRLPGNEVSWDVTADGKRFLVAVPVLEQAASTPVTVVLNWRTGMRP